MRKDGADDAEEEAEEEVEARGAMRREEVSDGRKGKGPPARDRRTEINHVWGDQYTQYASGP